MTISNLPLVTVVIPSYNHASYVKESIQSIIDQDYSNIELIIIDDGSKDISVDVINEMVTICQKRFTRFEFRHRPNKGLCATLNEALDWSKGEYFSPFASDDIALPHKISFLVSKIIDTDYSAVFGTIEHIGKVNNSLSLLDDTEHFFEDLLLQKNLPAAPAALIRTECIRSVGKYRIDVSLEDWYMWLTLTYNSKKLITYNKTVSLYRAHNSNTVHDRDKMYHLRKEIINLYSEHKLYEKALQKNILIKANEKASSHYIEPLILLIKSNSLSKDALKILIKSLTPKLFIKLKRAIF